MATRKGKTRPNRPPVKRGRAALSGAHALALVAPPTPSRKIEVVTLADIAELKANRVQPKVRAPRTTGEYGASGTQNVMGQIANEDYNTLFDGRNGMLLFDQMDRSDGQMGAAADIIKLPLRSARWHAEPIDDKATQKEKDIAQAVNDALFENNDWPMGESWDFYLRHLLMRVTHGFGCVEKVWMFDEDNGLLRWRRLAPRLPNTVREFIPNPDGSLKEIVQYVSTPGTAKFENRRIPSEYAIISVRERLGDNYYGRSVFRRLYKHWLYKDEAYRIDGIRLDRYGVGVPVATIKQGHILEADELNEIELTLQSLRSHERAYIIETDQVTFRIMVPDGQGGVTGLMDSVKHHDSMIVRGVLATFMQDHAEGLNTNRTATLADIFLNCLRAEANAIAGDIASQAVKPFCALNFDMTDVRPPKVVVSGLGELTVQSLAETIGSLVGNAAITAEDSIEEVLRNLLGLPPLPEGWKRGPKKPEVPAAPVDSGTGKPALNQKGKPIPNTSDAKPIAADAIEMSSDRFVRDQKGRFSKTGGHAGKAADASKAADVKGGGASVATAEGRVASQVSSSEAADPKFQAELAHVHDMIKNDPDVSDFERNNPVAAARAAREANRPFDELHPGGSEAYHKDASGNYTQERQKLHEEIIAQYTNKFGPAQEHPDAVVLGGLAGAGKTETLHSEVTDLPKYVNLSSDDIKGMLPEYNGTNAGWLHEESDHVAKSILTKAVNARQHVIVDVTMKSQGVDVPNIGDGVGGQVRHLVNQGYNVKLKFIEITTKQSGDAAMKRYAKKGRYVPPEYIRKAKSANSSFSSKNRETFETLKSIPGVKGWSHLDRRNPEKPIRTHSEGE